MKHSQSDEVFALGPFRIETGPRKLLKGTRKVKLGGKAFDVLAALCKAKGDIVNYDYMQHHIWSLDEVNVLDFRHNVQRRVGDIRRAIGDSEKKEIIQTVAGEGYRLYFKDREILVAEEQQHVPSHHGQQKEKDPVIPAGFNLIVDGMIINSVAELLNDDRETNPIRRKCHASYGRSLEDFAFALVYGSRLVTSNDFRPSVTTPDQPGKELAARLGEICERGTYPADVSGGRLLYDETARENIRADIERVAQCIANAGVTQFFRDYMVREAAKHLGTDSSLFQEDLEPEKYIFNVVRPYYRDRTLQTVLGPTATNALVNFLPSSPPNSEDLYAKNALREFATRNVLSLITIMWESDVFARRTQSWRLPHILRALVRQQSLYGVSARQQENLRDIVVQHALTAAFRNMRSTKKQRLITVLMNQRDEYPFKQIRTILEQEHLVFLTPDPKQEEKARRILRLIKDSAATSKHLDPDEFFLAQHSALRRLGTARARDYETELYRVFPVLRPPE